MITVMEWRTCPSFPDYEVSECGDLRRKTPSRTRTVGVLYKGSIDNDGYLRYSIRDEEGNKVNKSAHVLVAEAFIGPAPSPDHEVAHGNGSRVMHHWTNLRWATRLENHRDMRSHGTDLGGSRNGNAKLTDDQVRQLRADYIELKNNRKGRRMSELDRKYGICRAQVLRIASGKSWA